MSVIYLKHKTHGTKVASSENEAIEDEKHGWVRFDPVDERESLKSEKADASEKEKGSKKSKEVPDFLNSKE